MEGATDLIPEPSRQTCPMEFPDGMVDARSSHLPYEMHLESSAMERATALSAQGFNASSQLFFHMEEQRLTELIFKGKIRNALELVEDETGPMEQENSSDSGGKEFSEEKMNGENAWIQDDFSYASLLEDLPHSLKSASELNDIGSAEVHNIENLKELLYNASSMMEEGRFGVARKLVLELQSKVGQWLTVCNVSCSAVKRINGRMDYYAILGVDVDASQSGIENEYTKLSLKLNPDSNKFSRSESALQLVQEAKYTLVNPVSRSLYDISCGYKLRHDFRKEGAWHKFAVDQIWAIYSEFDGMPRTYCLVMQTEGTQVGYAELTSYVGDWWPFGCGQFIKRDIQNFGEVSLFSHQMNCTRSWKKGNEVAPFEIYPTYGEVWALYGKMDSCSQGDVYDASTEETIRVNFEYQLVIVASDYSCSTGIEVVKLTRKGDPTLFTPEGGAAQTFSAKQMHMFSHLVPSVRICGSGIDNCLLDLDERAVPSKLM